MDEARAAVGENQPEGLLAKIRQANDLSGRGDWERARVLYEDVFLHARDHLDDAEFRSRATVAAIGLQGVLRTQGDGAGAVALYEDLLGRLRRAVGDDDAESMVAEHNLALMVRSAGDVRRAREMAAAIVEHRCRVYGDDHPYTDFSRRFLAETAALSS